MKIKPITLDYETFKIESRPAYPPVPTSVSVQMPEWKAPRFYAWGHATGGNNCTLDDAKNIVGEVYHRTNETNPILCHNAKFDLEVSQKSFGLAIPPWHYFHDTMILLFLSDPHQRELALKPSAARLLGMPPEEQDAVKDWLLTHASRLNAEFGIKFTPSETGGYIAYAPGNIVKPYANGDVVRTLKLFNALYPEIVARGMLPAYDRERKCMPIFLRNEQEGIRVDRAALQRDKKALTSALETADNWLRKKLKAPDLEMDSDRQVAAALDKAGMITEWVLTPTGQKSTAKGNMRLTSFKDKKTASVYGFRARCATVLQTFVGPWAMYSEMGTGRMYTNWNLVRQAARKGSSGDTNGTRTGRPSSNAPNFLNMPKEFKEDENSGFVHPTFLGVPPLPFVRSYILPDDRYSVLGRRDFNQQELRILAHFEDDELMQLYRADPRLDIHALVGKVIAEIMGFALDRKDVKTLNFGMLYGMGLAMLAARIRQDVNDAKRIKAAQMLALPGVKALDKILKARGASGEALRTWGGREYFCEPPSVNKKTRRYQTFEYKLLNYLIQGSAADITKESIIRYDDVKRDGRLVLTVYDENNISVPKKALKSEMLILRDAMMSIELDVPLLSDGEYGSNLGALQSLKESAPSLSKWGM